MQDLTNRSATEFSLRIKSRALASVQVMTTFLDRIDALNPQLNAIVNLRPDSYILADAAQADQSPSKGWMHGLPISVKDLTEHQRHFDHTRISIVC